MLQVMLLLPLVFTGYTRDTVMVRMRDSTLLGTEIYKPDDTTGLPLPVIMCRSTYGPTGIHLPGTIGRWTDTLGYIYVSQDVRGRGRSQGVDSVFLDDGWRNGKWDGYDGLEWVLAQPWCDGRVGLIGGSACAATQYLLAGTGHPGLTCALPLVGAVDLYEQWFLPGGQWRKSFNDGWLGQQGTGYIREYYFDHYCKDTCWQYLNLWTRRDSVSTPMFHLGGWYDLFCQGTVEGYQLGRHLGNQRLLMGPWAHMTFNQARNGEITYPDGVCPFIWEYVDRWYDFWLRDSGSIGDIPQVSYYLMGPVDTAGYWNNWCEAADWPPADDTVSLYLREDSALSYMAPGTAEPPDTFTYDPHNPVTTCGGANLYISAGPRNQAAVWFRDDVLRYYTEPLEQDVIVEGRIWVRVHASSDRLDTDFTAKLVDVYPDGRLMLVTDGILMARHRLGLEREDLLVSGEVCEFNIDLWNTAYCFPAGHRIGLAVSSSNHPRFRVNLNNGGHPFRALTDTLVATNVVHHTPDHLSSIVFQGRVGGGIEETPNAEVRTPDFGPTMVRGVLFLPASPFTIHHLLFDRSGRMVMALAPGANDVRGLSAGVYFVRPWPLAASRQPAAVRKVVVTR